MGKAKKGLGTALHSDGRSTVFLDDRDPRLLLHELPCSTLRAEYVRNGRGYDSNMLCFPAGKVKLVPAKARVGDR